VVAPQHPAAVPLISVVAVKVAAQGGTSTNQMTARALGAQVVHTRTTVTSPTLLQGAQSNPCVAQAPSMWLATPPHGAHATLATL
jgi:hypothetical protein